jgi:hypothetical protein
MEKLCHHPQLQVFGLEVNSLIQMIVILKKIFMLLDIKTQMKKMMETLVHQRIEKRSIIQDKESHLEENLKNFKKINRGMIN